MLHTTINLKNEFPKLEHDVTLTSYLPENFPEFSNEIQRKCVIVLPGGGYEFLSEREGEPIALAFLSKNISTFVLKYTIAPVIAYPYPYLDVFAAIAYVRKNAKEFHIDPEKIAVIGFSAGGHLAATSSGLCNRKEYADMLDLKLEDIKINGCILSYPVISSKFPHLGTFHNATHDDPKLLELLSAEKLVTPDYPKTFIWHTAEDGCVDVHNSILMAEALANNKVFFELHIYPIGEHGLSLATTDVYPEACKNNEIFKKLEYNSHWIEGAIHFVKEYM